MKKVEKGFSTLLIVIILGIITMSLILYATTTSLWSVRGSIDDKNSVQSDQMSAACAEVALEAIRENNNFTGSGSESISGNNCSYDIINSGGNNRTINVQSTVSGATRKIRITTNAFNPIVISSWQNIGDF